MKSSDRRKVNFRVVGDDLPGLRWGITDGALVDREPVYVGIQRKKEVVGLTRGDAKRAVFNFPVEVLIAAGGEVDFFGPFVHGKKGERFVYLSWGEVGGDGSFTMFRRAKLKLGRIDGGLIAKALSRPSAVVQGSLRMTDDAGGPVCGSLVPENVQWRVLA